MAAPKLREVTGIGLPPMVHTIDSQRSVAIASCRVRSQLLVGQATHVELALDPRLPENAFTWRPPFDMIAFASRVYGRLVCPRIRRQMQSKGSTPPLRAFREPYDSQPIPSLSPSKWCGSGFGTSHNTVKFFTAMSGQFRSGGGGGMQKSGYDAAQLAGAAVGFGGTAVGAAVGTGVG